MTNLFVMPGSGAQQTADAAELPPDHLERERALDVERSWIVEAPAGSGKTGLLIQRFLKLLSHESVDQPEQVLAITFTVKATTEIRERILAQLEDAAQDLPLKRNGNFDLETRALARAVLDRDALLGWQLLDHPRRLNLRTIDSVCAEIARSLPVLSGGGGNQSPVIDAGPLYRDAARQTLMQLGKGDPLLTDALRTVLLHRDGNLAECERLIAEMLEWRDQWGELVPLKRIDLTDNYLDGTVLPKLQRALEQAICAGLTEFAQAAPPEFLQALCSLATSLATMEPYLRDHSPIAICASKVGLPSTNASDLEHWRALVHLLVTPSNRAWRKSFAKNVIGFETTPHQKKALKALLEEVAHREDLLVLIERVNRLPPAIYPPEQWVVAKALFRVLNRALAELQIVFAQRRECDFAELGLLARAALSRDGGGRDLSEALGMELRHLLVDEMQDTSTSQYELIQLLTQGWDGQSQTVFLVGDPKQSIYLFRQARVERFVRTMRTKMLGDLPLGTLQLTANFRSQRALVEEFNHDFALLFPRAVEETNLEEVAYVSATAVNGPSRNEGLGVVWHTRILPPDFGSEETRRARRLQAKESAEEARAIVQRWRSRPLPAGRSEPWKIAVLVRTRSHLLEVVTSFKRDDGEGSIPFRAIEIEPLKDRQEVLDLTALTRALLHPADRVAWLAILRAPWCGLELAELHMLTGADDPAWAEICIQDVIDERAHLLSEDSCARLARIWPVLRAAEKQRGRLTTAQRVERTWRSLGGDASLNADEMANARRYLSLLDEVEKQTGIMDLPLLQRRISKLFAETTVQTGAVDLMTIHGAKGLEWDLVLVPGLEKQARTNRNRLLTWSEISSGDKGSAHVILAPIAGKGEGSRDLNAWLNGIHNAREAAERKRLFYVACTRAREELHLFASPSAKTNGEIARATGSLLATAWPAAKRHFAGIVPSSKPARSVIVMQPADAAEDQLLGDLAAETEQPQRIAILHRLPMNFDPVARFKNADPLDYGAEQSAPGSTHFARPEGSFEARVFGNAVHAFMELLSKRLADGLSHDELRNEVMRWQPRIIALLRAGGIPHGSAEKLSIRVQSALNNTLQDAEGLWILAPHKDASSECALTAWQERRSSVRLDRIFRAGEQPLASGEGCLWIVDYKTTMHGSTGLEEFMTNERLKYAPQMQAYARILQSRFTTAKLRVGLYYPMLRKFSWWIPEIG